MTLGNGRVGVALIGAGTISDQYLADMVSYPDLDVLFVADVLTERAGQQATRYRVPGSGSPAEALAHDGVEIVVNLTIPAAHAEVAGQALEAGKHVWNEKPLATGRAEAVALLDRADALGLRVGCAPDTVLGPSVQTARRMIERGDIGQPRTASVVMQTSGPHHWHPNPDFLFQSGGGPLLDMGPYYLTALTQIFGSVRRVAALGSSIGPTRTIGSGPRAGQVFDVTAPTYVGALYEFADASVAQATFSFDSALHRVGVFEVAGTNGTIIAGDPNQFGGDVTVVRAAQDEGATVSSTLEVRPGLAGRGIGVLDMARQLRAGAPHRATGRLALHVLDALLSTEEAIDRGGFVDVGTDVEPAEVLPTDWDPGQRTL